MYSVEYTVSPANTTDKLNAKYITGSYYYLPIINPSSGGAKTPNDENIEVTLLDGSVVMGSNVAVSTIKSIKVYYAENSKGIRFMGTDGNPHRISSLINVDIQGFTSMERMFCCCPYLTEVNTSNWNVSKITVFGYMFYMCTSIKCLDLSSFKTRSSSSSNGYNMFDGWTSSQVVYISNDWTLDISSFDATFINLSTVKKIAVYTFDNTISTDCPIQLRSSESNNFKDFQVVDTVDGNITHRTVYVSDDVVITKMRIYYQSSLLTVEYMCIDENITSCEGLVANAKNLTYINTDNWDTKNTKDMSSMFVGCESLTDLNLSHLDTSQVEDMRMMFWSCKSLQNLNVTGLDTSKVDDMYGMFGYCTMTTLDISSFDTSSVTEYDSMFSGFSSTQNVYVGKKWTLGTSGFGASIIVTNTFTYTLAKYTFDKSVADCLPTITGATSSQWVYSDRVEGNITTRTIGTDEELTITKISFQNKTSLLTLDYLNFTNAITNASRMFSGCTDLTSIDTSNWDTSKVTNMSSMFQNCRKLTNLDLSHFNVDSVTNMSNMFQNCSSLTTLDLSHFNVDSVTNMGAMFAVCSSLTSLNTSNWNTGKVSDMSSMFQNCSSLTTLDLSHFKVDSVTNMNTMFAVCGSLITLNLSNWNTSKVSNMSVMFQNCRKLTNLDLSHFNVDSVTSMNNMFVNCESLTTLDLSNWNTSKVTNMSNMFSGCSKLTTLDLSHFKADSVTSMNSMFQSCSGLTSLNISNWNTSKVSNMRSMFSGCSKLTTLDLSNWDTSSVTSMRDMFSGCSALTTLDLSHFNVHGVTSMVGMFYYCASLTTLNLSNWSASAVTDMSAMFQNCVKLTTLDLSSWKVDSVTSMGAMFFNCGSLTTLDLSNWNTSKVTNMSNMFNGCSALTTVDLSNFDTSKVSAWGSPSGTNKLTNIGLVYASSSTINSIVTNWLGTSVARNVYYMDAELSELTTRANITYVPYSQSVLSCSEEITLRSNGDVYDELDLLTGQVIQRIGEDNEILEEEIVRTVELDGEIGFYENSYIHTSSNEITPEFEFQPTLTNCYVVSDLKPNTQYTVLFEGNPTRMSLGGTTIENPTSKMMITSGEVDNILWFDTSVSKIMILEGDLTNRDIEYFTGVKSSQKIEVQLRGNTPYFAKGGRK